MTRKRSTDPKRPATSVKRYQTLDAVRQRIDDIDAQIASLLAERLSLSGDVAAVKADLKIAIKDRAREQEVLDKVSSVTQDARISAAITQIYKSIFACSRQLQQENNPGSEPLYLPQKAVMGMGALTSTTVRVSKTV